MALAFLSNQAKKRDQIVAIDLGSKNTKAIHIQRKGEKLNLVNYALVDAPVYEKNFSADGTDAELNGGAECLDRDRTFR